MGQAWIALAADRDQSVLAECVNERELLAELLVARCLAAAGQGEVSAYYDLGVAFSTGSHGAECDLIEAHKWFNLAAVAGHAEAQLCRADIAEEMSAREIAEAQRRAREWLAADRRRAA